MDHRHHGLALPRRAVAAAALFAMMTALAIPASAASSAAAPGKSDPRKELAARAAEKGLANRDRDAMLGHVQRIEAAGLPVDAVLDRYLEGLAKNIPPDRIEKAVNELEARLVESARRVDAVFPPNAKPDANAKANTSATAGATSKAAAGAKGDAIQSGRTAAARFQLIDECAYALASGLKPDGLSAAMRLAADAHEGPAGGAPPVFAMGCLVGSGLSQDDSFQFVRTAWMHGYRGEDLAQLGRRLASLGGDDAAPPRRELENVLASIQRGDDRSKVFRDLDRLDAASDRGPGRHGSDGEPGDGAPESRGPAGPPDHPGSRAPGGRQADDGGRDGGQHDD